MKRCLLLIDVQKGFVSAETEYAVERIEGLLRRKLPGRYPDAAVPDGTVFDEMIATQFVNAENSPFRRFIGWNKLSGPPETDVLGFVRENADRVFVKNVYSAVNDELLSYLEEKEMAEVFLAGIDTDCCVLKTAADLFERNIDAKVLAYYTASNGGRGNRYAAIRVLKRMIGAGQIIRDKHF